MCVFVLSIVYIMSLLKYTIFSKKKKKKSKYASRSAGAPFRWQATPGRRAYRGQQVNRIAIVVSGENTKFLLGVPVTADSFGQEEATAILKELENKNWITR